jgi:hypothetical protein
MPAVRSPESLIGRRYSDNRIKELPCLVDHVREPLVMSVRQISLKRSWLYGSNRQNRQQQGMAAEWLFVGSNHATTSFLDGFGDRGGASSRLV